MAKFLYRFHEERGEAHLSVSDVDDVTVWQVNYPDYYEDENGEMTENSTIFDDGYMKNADDISGLEKYLKEMGVLQANDVITDDESDMDIDEENDDAEEEAYKYGDDVIEFTIPSWAVSTLINGDSSGLEDEDEEKLDKFTERTVRDYGNANFMLPNDEDLELGFKISNDIDGLGSDCVMLLLRPSKQGFASGGTTDSAVFGRFMTSEIKHVISLKKVAEKKRAIKAWLANMDSYVGDDIQKRITTDNLKYALTQKKASEINATLKTSLNALKDESGSFADGGHTDSEHVMASGGTTGKIVVDIEDGKIYILNMTAYNAATLNIMRKVQSEYIGYASAQVTKDYIKKELESRIHFDGKDATAENKERALNTLTLDIASKSLGHKGYFAAGGSIEEGNKEMILSNVKAIKHHSEEIEPLINKGVEVEAWVNAKAQRAATDLSDITHYLDGRQMAHGGYMAKGGQVVHKEYAIEYYKDDSLIQPTKDEKLKWEIYGLPNGIVKKEQYFETIIDEFNGKTKKEIEEILNKNISIGKYNYLGHNPNLQLVFKDKMFHGGYMAEGGMIYKMANNMTDAEYEKKLSSLNEKQKNTYESLVRLGDSPKLALATTLLSNEVKWSDETIKAYTMSDGGYMAKGGGIEDKFTGKNSKEVWNDLDFSTRAKVLEYLFLKENNKANQYYDSYNSLNELSYYDWDKLPKNIKNEIENFEDGGYMARGGKADEYQTYHDTLSGVLREADKFVENRGYTFVDESYSPDVTNGGIPYGHTAKVTRGIQKEGRKKQDVLILAIYRMDSGKYELTMYTSYEHGGSLDENTFDIKKSVNDFVETLNKKYSDSYLFTVTFANKYAKILHQPIVRGELVTGKATWGFVVLENDTDKGYFEGDLLKAAGASTPAKGARGNILNGTAQYDKYSPQYGKGWRSEGGRTLGNLIFEAETRGGKYCMKVFKSGNGYEVEKYKNGNSVGFGGYNNKETLTEAINYDIDGSSKIDNINYEVKLNSEGIKMLPVNKTEHPLSRKQIKEKLGHTSGYAAGGTIESKVKNRIKDAFELPLQVAIYVPSTKEKNVIVSRREFEKRIDEVEKFLAQIFGGFSAVKVEGGFESSDKGLVQEDAVRVVAFASKENEHGTTFDKSFQELIEHVKNWCTDWSQESIGVEFENDLFYVDANTKYAEGGTTPEQKVKVFEKCRITIKDVDMGGDTVYKGDHWINKEMIAKMSNKEIGDAIAKKYGLDYGNTFKYTIVKTGETREKFEEGGMPESFNIDSFLKHVYPDTKKILLRNGLVIAEDFSVTDGGTTDYTHFPFVMHSDGKAAIVSLNYVDNIEDNFGDITYNLNDMTIDVSFPQWDVADSGSYEYELHEDGGQVSRNKEIASIILQQIGGMNRLHMMTGAYNFQALKNGVSFRIKNAKANYIKIVLNGKDLYDVEIGRIRGNSYNVVFSENDVYNEELKSTIEKNTGMYLSLASGGLNVGRMYKNKEGKIIRYVGNKDTDNGIFIAQDGKYESIPFSEVKFEEGGINEQAGEDRIAKELYDPYTSGNPNGGYYAGIRYKGFLHDHKICDTREEAVKWLDDYDTKAIQTPHNDEAALSKFKNLLNGDEFAKGGTLHEKMNYIFKKYRGHKNEDGTYLEIEKIGNDSDGRIHVTSPYWNTLSEIKKIEFDNDAILQKVKDKYVLISNKPYGYMAKGGKVKDEPVIRQYFEDEAFEYAKGGTVVGNKIYFTESEVKTYLRQKFDTQLKYNLDGFAKKYYAIKYNASKKIWEEYGKYPMNEKNYKGELSEDEVKKKLRHAFRVGLEYNLKSAAEIFNVKYDDKEKKYYHSVVKAPDGSIQGYAKGGTVKDIPFSNSNLYLHGEGVDSNGNHIIKVTFPNQRAFAIQTNGTLPKTNNLIKSIKNISELSSEQLDTIEKEVVEYVSAHGSAKQKKTLSTYGSLKNVS